MPTINDPTHSSEANAMADRLPPPDDLLVRILISSTLLVALDPGSPLHSTPPVGFDCRPLVDAGARFFEQKDLLRHRLLSADCDNLTRDLLSIAAGFYRAAPDIEFVGRAASLVFSKPQLLLNILDGGRDPFEGLVD